VNESRPILRGLATGAAPCIADPERIAEMEKRRAEQLTALRSRKQGDAPFALISPAARPGRRRSPR